MKKIAIISALGREIKYVRDRIDLKESYQIKGYRYSRGIYKDYEILLGITSVGKVNAALASHILIEEFKPTALINLGIAGAIAKDISLLDLVVAEKTRYYDIADYILKGTFPHQEKFVSNPLLLNHAEKAAKSWEAKNKVHFGEIISGDAFIDSSKEKEELRKLFKPLCVDMEGAAMAHSAFINNIPYLGIRAISDLADDSARDKYAENELLASQEAGKFIFHLLDNPV